MKTGDMIFGSPVVVDDSEPLDRISLKMSEMQFKVAVANDWYIKFYPGGHVEINPTFTNEGAACGFWEAVEQMRPTWAK